MMDEYRLRSYFKSLSSSLAIVRKELKRANEQKAAEKDIFFWERELKQIKKSIVYVLSKIHNSNFSLVITTEEEVIALMLYYQEYLFISYPFINTDKMYLKVFPKSEMCNEFLDAYFEVIISDATGTDTGIDQMLNVINKYL